MMQDLIKQTNKKSSKSKKRDKLRNNKKKIFSFVVAYQQDNFHTELSTSHIQLVTRACCRHAQIWLIDYLDWHK